MYLGRVTLGLIPARGGSKGLPRKNLLPFAGKPLIAWTVASALGSSLVDRTVVTTDDEEIAAAARAAGAEVPFMRPAELASDTSPSIDAVLHALDFLEGPGGQPFDYVALLEPTSPLRAPDDIDRAIRLLADRHETADAVVSVGEIHMEHPSIAKRIGEDGYLQPYLSGGEKITRRQDLGVALFPYGVVYLAKTSVLREQRTFYPQRTLPLALQRWQAYEIDDVYDLVSAEAVLTHRQEQTQ